jgi:hypothetical protein
MVVISNFIDQLLLLLMRAKTEVSPRNSDQKQYVYENTISVPPKNGGHCERMKCVKPSPDALQHL